MGVARLAGPQLLVHVEGAVDGGAPLDEPGDALCFEPGQRLEDGGAALVEREAFLRAEVGDATQDVVRVAEAAHGRGRQ